MSRSVCFIIRFPWSNTHETRSYWCTYTYICGWELFSSRYDERVTIISAWLTVFILTFLARLINQKSENVCFIRLQSSDDKVWWWDHLHIIEDVSEMNEYVIYSGTYSFPKLLNFSMPVWSDRSERKHVWFGSCHLGMIIGIKQWAAETMEKTWINPRMEG